MKGVIRDVREIIRDEILMRPKSSRFGQYMAMRIIETIVTTRFLHIC